MEKITTSFENVEIDQRRCFIRPPFFCGFNLAHREKLMQIFIKDDDDELWEIISEGDFIPFVKKDDKDIPKPRSEFTPKETQKVAKNYSALDILF